jgi:hypothetical protein
MFSMIGFGGNKKQPKSTARFASPAISGEN